MQETELTGEAGLLCSICLAFRKGSPYRCIMLYVSGRSEI